MFLGYNYRIMLKYFLGFVFLLAISVFVTSQYQKYAHHPATPSKSCGNATVASTNPQNPTTDAEDAERNHPCWYLAYQVFGWPNGITVWALFLTLMTIAEQTRHTARAADTANKTLISQSRPKLIVRRIWIREGTQIPTIGVPDAKPWRIQYHIANIGGSIAHVQTCNFAASIFDSGLPSGFSELKIVPDQEPFSLEAGEDKKLEIDLGEMATNLFRIMGGIHGRYLAHQNTAYLFFWGDAKYTDALGVARNIAVFRHFQTDTAKFKPIDDPDREYSD